MGLRILFYTAIEGEVAVLGGALKRVRREYGPLIEMVVRTKRDLAEPEGETGLLNLLSCCHLVLLHLMGGSESLPGFDRLTALAKEQGIPLAVLPSAGDDAAALFQCSTIPAEDYQQARLYVSYGGENNLLQLLRWAANRYLGKALSFKEPQPIPWEGLYHPDFPGEEAAAAALEIN